MKQCLFSLIILLMTFTVANAGTLVNGNWSPATCGEKPEPPVIDATSPESFNRSVDAINEWQDRALTYNSCLIEEANADNDLIAETANRAQDEFRNMIDRINAEAEVVRDKINSR